MNQILDADFPLRGHDFGATVVSVDTFNDPNLTVPEAGAEVTISFPPEAVLVLEAPPATTAEDLIAEA